MYNCGILPTANLTGISMQSKNAQVLAAEKQIGYQSFI